MAMLSIILLSTLVSVAGLAGCNREKPAEVHLDRRIAQAPMSTAKGPKPLRLGMGAMITPKEGYVYYYQLKEYLAEKIGRPIDLVDRDNYTEIDKMLEKRELEIGFVCSGPYVEGHDRYGLEIIAVPEVNGVSTYQAYIIVPQKSPAQGVPGTARRQIRFYRSQIQHRHARTHLHARPDARNPQVFLQKGHLHLRP